MEGSTGPGESGSDAHRAGLSAQLPDRKTANSKFGIRRRRAEDTVFLQEISASLRDNYRYEDTTIYTRANLVREATPGSQARMIHSSVADVNRGYL